MHLGSLVVPLGGRQVRSLCALARIACTLPGELHVRRGDGFTRSQFS
jgi:hypothetical protein